VTDPTLTARSRLARCGIALYGERWQSDLARALDVGARRVRAWVAGEEPVPAGVWADIVELLRDRADGARELIDEITAGG